jgi:DNA-binding CsgD family transcriptional regulator
MTTMPAPPLGAREYELLTRVANGETFPQIAKDWCVEEISVRTTSWRVRRKLGATTITHAVFRACQVGILDPKQRHGDHPGFMAHKRRGEDPWACELGCPEGERAYRRERREARKAARSDLLQEAY